MSASSAVPPLGLPKRGVTGGGAGAANSSSSLPRKPLPTDAVPPTGKKVRMQEPEARPPPKGAAGSETKAQGNARPNVLGRVMESAGDRLHHLQPAALNPRPAKTTGNAPPPISTKSHPEHTLPSSSFSRSPVPKPLRTGPSAPAQSLQNQNRPTASQQTATPGPLRTGQRGPAPPLQNQNRPATSQDPPTAVRPPPSGSIPPVPGQSRSGPSSSQPSRPGQPVPDALRSGMARQGQGPALLPRQPGPAPAGPVPTPVKSPLRKNTPVNNSSGNQGHPQLLRVGNLSLNTQQKTGTATPVSSQTSTKGAPPTALDPSKATDPNRPRPGPTLSDLRSPTGAAGLFARKPANLPPQADNQAKANPSVYRPSATGPPPQGQKMANSGPPPVTATGPSRAPPPNGPPPPQRQGPTNTARPSATSPPGQAAQSKGNPPGVSGARPGPANAGPNHGHSNSTDSNKSKDSTASSATATSKQSPSPPKRQNTSSSKPTPPKSDPRDKGSPGGGGRLDPDVESGQTPYYTNMLLSLDTIPRLHHILVLVFVWILLAGFVVILGSFTSTQRKQEGETVQLPVGGGGADGGGKLALTPANTAALVIGFICIVTGTFGSAWLALRWRRNYVWLLNKLYMPMLLNALAGVLATIVNVYTQQAGEWSPQAIVVAIVEASIFVIGGILFWIYNYWLLQRVKGDHPEEMTDKKKDKEERKREKKEKKERKKKEKREKKDKKRKDKEDGDGHHKKKGKKDKKKKKDKTVKPRRRGLFAKFMRLRPKSPPAAGSDVQGRGDDGRGNQAGGNQVGGSQVGGKQVRANEMSGNEMSGNQQRGNQVRGNETKGNEGKGNGARVNGT